MSALHETSPPYWLTLPDAHYAKLDGAMYETEADARAAAEKRLEREVLVIGTRTVVGVVVPWIVATVKKAA